MNKDVKMYSLYGNHTQFENYAIYIQEKKYMG
jgi:hypothetical protein